MANDDVVRLSAVGDVARGRWRGLVALAVAGAVIGFGASFVLSPGQAAAAKVLLQGQRSADQLLTETQIATSTSVTDQVAAKLGDGRSGQALQSVIHADVLDGNVIQISATAGSADAARALADDAATAYVDYSTKITADAAQTARDARQQQRDQIQSRLTDLDRQIAAPPGTSTGTGSGDQNQTPAQLQAARAAAQAQLDEFDRQAATDSSSGATTGSVSILEKAQDQGAATPSRTQLIGGGAILFALLGLLVMLRNRRRSGRVTDPATVESALRAPVVGTVTVARAAAPAPAGGHRGGAVAALFADRTVDDLAPLPAGRVDDETVRYRRALRRVRGEDVAGTHDLLVVVASDDETAVRATAGFVTAAHGPIGKVAVVTESEQVRAALAEASADGQSLAVADDDALFPETDLCRVRIVAVDVEGVRPTVPDQGPVDATLVVTSVATRTVPELSDLAGAVLDAGHTVTGVLLVQPRRAAGDHTAPTDSADSADPAPPVDGHKNGHTNGVTVGSS